MVCLVSILKRGVPLVVAYLRTAGTNFTSLFATAANTTIAENPVLVLMVITQPWKQWFIAKTNYMVGYFVMGEKKMIFIDESLTRSNKTLIKK